MANLEFPLDLQRHRSPPGPLLQNNQRPCRPAASRVGSFIREQQRKDRPGRQAKAYQKGRSPTVQNCTSQAKVRDETCPLISGQTDDNDIPPFLDRTAADQEDDDDEDAEPPGAFPPGQGRAGLQEPSL
jgi:hypothetical protein